MPTVPGKNHVCSQEVASITVGILAMPGCLTLFPRPFCLFSAVYANTELASTYLVRGSPRSQRDMLLYAGRTAYVCWRHLAEAVRCVSAAPASPQGRLRAGFRACQEATC